MIDQDDREPRNPLAFIRQVPWEARNCAMRAWKRSSLSNWKSSVTTRDDQQHDHVHHTFGQDGAEALLEGHLLRAVERCRAARFTGAWNEHVHEVADHHRVVAVPETGRWPSGSSR